MTTSRSSSQLDKSPTAELVDAQGRPFSLGPRIGKGGEGTVYEVAGDTKWAVKVYHDLPLDADTEAKLQTMAELASKDLARISAWPTSVLYKAGKKVPCGLLMPRIQGARQLHELYGTTNRKRHFPEVRWHHMLLAARNVAAAFHSVHEAGVVVGDVNQGNLLVDSRMRVRFIDCDSFQIARNGRVFSCPVGTPHFTPGELHALKLRDVERTIDHDGFGLAVLIFHLVFVGRHPFAGRFRGEGDLPIERAIADQRFAFSRDRTATLVDPPPASLTLDDLPEPLADLFERAFRGSAVDGSPRPTTEQWAEQLDHLMSHRKVCSFDELHVYYDQLDACPWCRIEDEGGPTFFVKDAGASAVSSHRLQELDRRIGGLHVIAFPELGHRRLEPPHRLPMKELDVQPKLSSMDAAAAALVVAAVLSLLAPLHLGAWAAGSVLAIAAGCHLLFSPAARRRRERELQAEETFAADQAKLRKTGRVIAKNYQKRMDNYKHSTDELRKAAAHYRAEGEELRKVLKEHRHTHRDDYLRGILIRDHGSDIPAVTEPVVAMLESFGVESALDIDELSLAGIPNIDSVAVLELLQWRAQLERDFKFTPDHGVTEKQLQLAEDAATQRFKLVQARRVLMGAKQLDQMAHAGEIELKHALIRFDQLAGKTRNLAKELCDVQSNRRKLERLINQSPQMVITLMIAIPVVGGILYLVIG